MFACLMSPEEREQARISREIQKMLDQDKKQQDKELKLLLLGKRSPNRRQEGHCTESNLYIIQALANLVRVRLSSK